MKNMQIDVTAIILSILSFLSTITLGILQLRKLRAESREANSRAETNLVEIALKISEREVTTLRQVNEDLLKRNKELVEENNEKNKIIDSQETIIHQLKLRLEMTQPRREDDHRKDEKGLPAKE